jgi:hypothetical protein
MRNETRHTFRHRNTTIPARGRAASATVVAEHASKLATWARRHEKVEFFSKEDEENDSSQSERQLNTPDRMKIMLGSCEVV